jgi:hypothetical protein
VSDARARDAERTAATGVDAEARALVERMRAGALTWDEVALDAYLGHAPAQLALGEAVEPVPLGSDDDFVVWARGLLAWGRETAPEVVTAWALALAGDEVETRADLAADFRALERWCLERDAARFAESPQEDDDHEEPPPDDLTVVWSVLHSAAPRSPRSPARPTICCAAWAGCRARRGRRWRRSSAACAAGGASRRGSWRPSRRARACA